jgi:hypothetical protein
MPDLKNVISYIVKTVRLEFQRSLFVILKNVSIFHSIIVFTIVALISKRGFMNENNKIQKLKLDEDKISENSEPFTLLIDGFNRELVTADNFINDVVKILEKNAGELAQIQNLGTKSYRLVVDASDELLEKIDEGSIKLTSDRFGNIYAQINNSGKFGKKLPIKREDITGDIDFVDIARSLQLKAIQNQLEDLANQILVIDGRVKEVLQGQQNDRIGLFESGMSLYLEAREIEDEQLHNLLVAQSQRALSDAVAQLSLEMKSAISYLESGQYNKYKKQREEFINEKMVIINRCFPIIHQASIAKAAIYFDCGESRAMLSSLKSYSKLIEETVGKSAGLLSECDVLDDGTEKGIWKSRAKLILDVEDSTKVLLGPESAFYLEPVIEEDENHEVC